MTLATIPSKIIWFIITIAHGYNGYKPTQKNVFVTTMVKNNKKIDMDIIPYKIS